MGLFGWFGRRKKKNRQGYDISELDMGEILGRREAVNGKLFDKVSRTQYINTQCEQIIESSKYIDEVKKEYASVTEYLNDIQVIESLEPEQRKMLSDTAQDVYNLDRERLENRKRRMRLPSAKFNYYMAHEDELEDALIKLQNDEEYFQVIRRDLNMLEAEKMGLREDIEKSVIRQGNVKNISIIGVIAIVIAAAVMIATGTIKPEENNYVLTVLLFAVTVFIVAMFVLNRNAIYMLKLSEKKLNRAIVMQNKIKIKYINIVNSIEYQYTKYGVQNAYEFSSVYQMFLDDKKDREYYAKTTGMLGRATEHLILILKGLGLHDASIWQNQLEALFDPKEMVEVRHGLNTQRQKLREQMEYNMKRINEAKINVTEYIKKNPQYAGEVMAIVDSYDMDM